MEGDVVDQGIDRLGDVAVHVRRQPAGHVVLVRQAHPHGEVAIAHLRADGIDHLEEEAHAVLGGAAVLVVSLVERRREELVQQVAARGVDVDAVEAGVADAPGGAGEVLHEVVDLPLADRNGDHGPAQEVRDLAGRPGFRSPHHLALRRARVIDLMEHLHAVFVHGVPQLLQVRLAAVVPEADRPGSVGVDARRGHGGHADPTFRPGDVIGDEVVAEKPRAVR